MRALSQSSRWSNVFATALAPVIWGSTYIVAAEILPAGRPLTAATIRTVPAGLLLLLFARRFPLRSQWARLLLLSALNIGAFQALLFVAAYRLPGGLAAVLGSVQPLLLMLLVWMADGEAPSRATALAAISGIVGMAVLLLDPGASYDPLGAVAAIAGAACMAAGIWLTRRSKLDLPVVALTGWQLLLGGLMLVPICALGEQPLTSLSPAQVAGYTYLCLAGAVLGYTLWFRGIKLIPPVAASSLGLLSPLTAVALGWLLLSQAMTPIGLLGMGMVLISVLAVQWSTVRRV